MEIVVVLCFFFKFDFSSPSVFLEDSYFFFLGGGQARWCNSPLPTLEFFTHL